MSVVNTTNTSFNSEGLFDTTPSRLILLTPLFLIIAIFLFSPNFDAGVTDRSEPFGGDFLQEWVGGHIVVTGHSNQLYDPNHFRSVQHNESLVGFRWSESKYFPPVYPPFYYAAMSGLALINYKLAVFIWGLLSALALIATGELIWRYYEPAQANFGMLFLASMIFVPLLLCFTMGHKSTFLLFLLTATFLLLKHNRDVMAGLVFGFIAFKPHLVIVIGVAMLFQRNWRFVGGAFITLLIGLITSLQVGWEPCSQYFRLCLGMGSYVQTDGYQSAQAHSLWGACQNLLPGLGPVWIKGLAATGVVGVILILIRLMSVKTERDHYRFDAQFAAMVIATVLIAPHFYTYDLVILLLPMMVFTTKFLRRGESTIYDRVLFGAALVLLLFAGMFEQIAEAVGVQPSIVVMITMLVAIAGLVRIKPYRAVPDLERSAQVAAS